MRINLGKYQVEFKKRETINKPANYNSEDGFGGLNTLEFVSHELKGILGSTIMCVYSIRDGFLGMLNFKQRASIETTIRNLKRLESTIKDFLDISRIQEGKLTVRKMEVNINEDIINEVEDAFLSEIYESRMIFDNRIPEGMVISTDRNLLLTVFNNLVSNAIKYGVTGGSIIIKAETFEKMARFSVFNSGVSIREEDRQKLFKKFSRIDAEQHRRIKGTGLGLFIIYDIIKNLGGSIWHEMHEDGNEFIFEIERV